MPCKANLCLNRAALPHLMLWTSSDSRCCRMASFGADLRLTCTCTDLQQTRARRRMACYRPYMH